MSDGVAMPDQSPWLLIAGGFHREGGMDRANAALARHLSDCGVPLHLVGYRVERELREKPQVEVHQVQKPLRSFFLGERKLDRVGRRIAAEFARNQTARIVVNGVNCRWFDINWVHYVHHAWTPPFDEAPVWLRAKMQLERELTLRREREILPRTRFVIANSAQTRDGLVRIGVDAGRIAVVYPAGDEQWQRVSAESRRAARAYYGLGDETLVIFVGAFGYDSRKGFDTLWEAWRRLARIDKWKGALLAAGEGRALEGWRERVRREGASLGVKLLGFTNQVDRLLAAADLLVSPVRYEPYGLNVHEAIASGVPAIVSACAGIAERYPRELKEMLLRDSGDPDELMRRILLVRDNWDNLKHSFNVFGDELRRWTGRAMAQRIVRLEAEHRREFLASSSSASYAGVGG